MNRRTALFLIFVSFCWASPSRSAPIEDLKKAQTLNESAISKTKAGDLSGAENDLLAALEYSDQDPKLRKNLAALYYERGALALRAANFYEAEKYLKLSLGIDPGNEIYSRAFASALSLEADSRAKIGQNEEALELYKKAASYDEKNVSGWIQAAHYAWSTQRMDLAREYLERAKAIDPADKNALLLEEKLKKSSNEADSGARTSLHFILSAPEGDAVDMTSDAVLGELEKVYDEVSYQLNYFPQNKITVVFYPVAEFHDHWKLPARMRGLYDGKLRIPYSKATATFEAVRSMIKHELTHAFISSITKKPIPQWMNEGLAQWVEGKKIDIKSKDSLVMHQLLHRVPDIAHLDKVFLSMKNPFNNNEMTLAYMKGFSLTEYLIEEYGVWSVVQFAQNQGAGLSSDELFKKYFLGTPAEVEARWFRWLERKKSNYVFN